ncbi:RNase adapter RapZ [Suttonella ornithocola]|uniref:GlmZ(SRNA)-inactivating NTPase n=1 Tax=Suttonella ornithocola TaxID=279832 RepID=A0A380MU63_9GAMM|nr:RNase adapter RapZ [Suttonella ornithocola]SUO95586.1 glmZ(sRNA)-inactivating NTPase [Suttonella ornithocola]
MLIVSGLSGAGKTITLNILEDLGYYCVDNLPVALLNAFVKEFASRHHQPVAVAIDARNADDIRLLPETLRTIRQQIPIQVLFLTTSTATLARRFNESRRPHPLHLNHHSPAQIVAAIEKERELLGELNNLSDILIDTSNYNAGILRDKIIRLLNAKAPDLMITLQSFGFKHGTPVNADFVFDVRFLPNPYWVPELRRYSGTQAPIIEWLDAYPLPQQFVQQTADYLKNWLGHFLDMGNRAYLTICIGCTGGQHRSVYVTERLATILIPDFPGISVEHRDMISYIESNETQQNA